MAFKVSLLNQKFYFEIYANAFEEQIKDFQCLISPYLIHWKETQLENLTYESEASTLPLLSVSGFFPFLESFPHRVVYLLRSDKLHTIRIHRIFYFFCVIYFCPHISMMKSKEIEFGVCFTYILQENVTHSNTKSRYFKKVI